MPKLYEYLGIVIMFYSNEHEPIHVHAKHGGRECKAEILVRNGFVVGVRFIPVGQGLDPGKQKDLEAFVKFHADAIVKKWVDFFVYKKPIRPELITKRV